MPSAIYNRTTHQRLLLQIVYLSQRNAAFAAKPDHYYFVRCVSRVLPFPVILSETEGRLEIDQLVVFGVSNMLLPVLLFKRAGKMVISEAI